MVAGCLFSTTTKDDYVCVAHSHSQHMIGPQILELGGCLTQDNTTYCNIAEFYDNINDSWVQQIDTDTNEPLDQAADFYAIIVFDDPYGQGAEMLFVAHSVPALPDVTAALNAYMNENGFTWHYPPK